MKKKGKVSSIVMVLLPFVLCLLVQLMVGAIGGVILGVHFTSEWIMGNMIYILVATHLSMAAAFGFWYWNVCQNRREAKIKEAISVRNILIIVLYALGLLILINGAYHLLDLINPSIMDGYGELMETAGIGSGIWSLIATVFLAPIGEECVFRGLTLYYLEKAGAKFWLANLIQALLFGIMHGNLVQGTYAFVLGLLLGQLVNKYKSIYVGILFHMVFNLFGSTISPIISVDAIWLRIIIVILGIAAIVVGFILCTKDETRERKTEKRVSSFTFYQAYTPKNYRLIVHLVLPIIFTLLGAILLTVREFQGAMATTIMVLLLFTELIGEYIAFGASCSRTASPINWVKSSHKGRTLFQRVYRWDILIKAVKYTVIWLILGLIPIWCDNWGISVLTYLMTMVVVFLGANIVRRIDNIQILSMVMMPVVAASAAIVTLILKYEFLIIPAAIILAILAVVEVVLTYRLSMGAYEKSFHDA